MSNRGRLINIRNHFEKTLCILCLSHGMRPSCLYGLPP